MQKIWILCLAILLTSCAMKNYYAETAKSWQGASASSLKKAWGEPNDLMKSPNGNTVLVYKSQSFRPTSAPTAPMIGVHLDTNGKPTIVTTGPSLENSNRGVVTCIAAFSVNKRGVVTDVVTSNHCFGDQTFMDRLAYKNAR